ncbi:MAG TPA: WecB/TagA/CpsF family glycosyltransferase [Sphingobium sp.]
MSLVSDFPRPSPMTILGYRLHPMTGVEVVEQISSAVREERRLIMANLNVHAMAVMYDSPGMARLFAQDDCLVMVDGMPILLIANIFYRAGLRRDKRTTSLDFYNEMFGLGASCGWKFAYIGGTADVLARGMDVLAQRFPCLKIEGRDGYFDFPNNSPTSAHQEILGWLRDYSPDVVIVGMGMPRQEEWIELIQNQIDARVFLPTGAYLDYQVGAQKPAPRWLGRYGLEGAYRLMRSPYRLGYRYLVEPFVLGYRILTGSPISTTRPDPTKSRI